MNVVAVVVGIVVLVALVQAAIWIPLGLRWRRTNDEFWAKVDHDVAEGRDDVVIPRQRGIYRGGTPPFGQVKGNGQLLLTAQRLVFRKVTGGVVEVPTATITGAARQKVFLGAVVGGRDHLVVTTDGGAQVGFFVDDPDAWISKLDGLAAG